MEHIENTISFIQALYFTLRLHRPNYKADDYKWRLGTAVIRQCNDFYNTFEYNTSEKKTLYGIDVEIDYSNPYNLQLYEDITNKLAGDEKGANNG